MENAQPKKSKRSSQGPLVIWHGMTVRQLARFFRYGPLLSWRRSLTTATLPGMAVYNSVMALAEKAVYGTQLRSMTIDKTPLFVIGHWRSGTTLLHNLLAQDPQFCYPNMYETLFPNHFLLTENVSTKLTASLVPQTRPMDNLPAGWSIPQEEDIAMAILTCVSPYMIMAHPDREERIDTFFDLQGLPPAQLRDWKQEYMTFLKKVSLRSPDRRLVVKSPVNTLRIPVLLDLFPDAKFVFIYRNPFDVWNSSVHLRRTVFRENCLGFPKLDGLETAISNIMDRTSETYQRDKALLPPGRLHEVKFEELEQDPVGELAKVYSALNLEGFSQLEKILEPQVPELKRFKKNKFKYDREHLDAIYERHRPLFDLYGYPHPAEQYETAAA